MQFKNVPMKADCFEWKDKSVKELQRMVLNL